MSDAPVEWTAFRADAPPPLPDEGRIVAVLASVGAMEDGWGPVLGTELARAWGEAGRRVVLIDGGLTAPSLHGALGVENDEGLSDAVLYGASVGRVARRIDELPLFFVPAGTVVADSRTVPGHARWAGMCEGFVEAGATVVLFLPEDEPAAEAALAEATDLVRLQRDAADVPDLADRAPPPVLAVLGAPASLVAAPAVPAGLDEPVDGAWASAEGEESAVAGALEGAPSGDADPPPFGDLAAGAAEEAPGEGAPDALDAFAAEPPSIVDPVTAPAEEAPFGTDPLLASEAVLDPQPESPPAEEAQEAPAADEEPEEPALEFGPGPTDPPLPTADEIIAESEGRTEPPSPERVARALDREETAEQRRSFLVWILVGVVLAALAGWWFGLIEIPGFPDRTSPPTVTGQLVLPAPPPGVPTLPESSAPPRSG